MNKPQTAPIDHLFRHQHGKMVAVLVSRYGLPLLASIEDAVQDSFIAAMKSWPKHHPDNPEAWLMRAAMNRLIDITRKENASSKHLHYAVEETSSSIDDPVLDNEVSDSQLRMIFTACHPFLETRDQIAFSLRTMAGFSEKEIAAALLLKRETVKKRLQRARKAIQEKNVDFEIPVGNELMNRLDHVHLVIYLIFNEGFHSTKPDMLVREDLCGEATRLCRMLIDNPSTQTLETYALFALLCFQSARLRSKTNSDNEVISLRHQDRSLWYGPLIEVGNTAMTKAVSEGIYSRYHYEAAIAFEHVSAKSFEETNWSRLLKWYTELDAILPTPLNQLNLAMVNLQLKEFGKVNDLLESIDPLKLEQRAYLYYGLKAEYFTAIGDLPLALSYLDQAMDKVHNKSEEKYLRQKRDFLSKSIDNQ